MSVDAALHCGLTLPVFLGQFSFCRLDPIAPPTRKWESEKVSKRRQRRLEEKQHTPHACGPLARLLRIPFEEDSTSRGTRHSEHHILDLNGARVIIKAGNLDDGTRT